MPSTLPSDNPSSLPTFLPASIPSRDPSQAHSINLSRLSHLFLSDDPYCDTSLVPSYEPSVNPYISPNEKQVGSLQEESWTKFEQVKSLKNTIVSGDIKVDEAALLQVLYIIKLKSDIFMLETNEQNFS